MLLSYSIPKEVILSHKLILKNRSYIFGIFCCNMLRFSLLFVLLFFCDFVMAQEKNAIEKEAQRIDNLIFYCQFTEGEKELDSLYNIVVKNHQYKEIELALLLQKSYLYSRKLQLNKALEISLKVIELAQQYNFPENEYQAKLMAATMYEHSGEFHICKRYLDEAYKLYAENNLINVYSIYCIRISSYYRFVKKKDSAINYAYKGIAYAQKYQNKREYIDGCLLLGILLEEKNYQEAIKYSLLAVWAFLNKHDFESAVDIYNNIAHVYLQVKELNNALQYSDSALFVATSNFLPPNEHFLKTRYQIFDAMGIKDSAYYYLLKYHNAYVGEALKMQATQIRNVTEKYQNDKKEAIIKSKNQQMIFMLALLSIITAATLLLIRKNRKIFTQNKIIQDQLAELIKALEQKQVLLSEFQHRVKNNLQHVISILEIQKESVDFNNIEELIRGNQSRIHSMAILHKKLKVSDSVNDVDFKRYIIELADLVKDSYDNHKKKIIINIKCTLEVLCVDKALPLGLILVELISNSLKHAFNNRIIGIITIEISKEVYKEDTKFYYSDNGVGFDFEQPNTKGLGVEIIKGLIDQLDGSLTTNNNNGFELTVYFK